MENQILSPKTEQHLFKEIILPPLQAGENLTIVWVPHAGRKKTMVYLSKNADKFGFKNLGKYLIYYIDHDELTEETPATYFQLMLKNIGVESGKKTPDEEPFYTLREKVERLIGKGFHLIFTLGRFDELNLPTYFYNNLHSLWQLDKTKVHFIFAVSKNIFREEIYKQYGQLREALCQNLIYFPIHHISDSRIITDILVKKYGYKLSNDQISLAEELGGGHPALIKACLRLFNAHPELKENQLIDFINQQWEVRTILEDIWNSLGDEEKTCLSSIAKDKSAKPDNFSSSLLQLRLIISEKDSSLRLFSPLFESFVKGQKIAAQTLSIDPQSGEILVDGYPPQEKISLQEYHLLATFLNKPQTILNRDQIAEILWGKGSYEKYSDWAIDQIISQLRKKLEKIGISSKNLQTIRGRGYRWISS